MADHGFSERRACRLLGVNRSAWQYEPLRGKDDAVRERMREIANEHRRFPTARRRPVSIHPHRFIRDESPPAAPAKPFFSSLLNAFAVQDCTIVSQL
ncbi:hypothetical protein [Sphingomonas sp. SORGH_AS_0879]|uniref:hypothetical protein n=1 Tax=Sphingomonas sp. SORGH_AS_0879 TaxID=3041790 RepID=UPI002781580A|nr:hypothetical protein [Sphingomonas sp. SORGH_AS_0879]